MGMIRSITSFTAAAFYRPTDDIATEYHKWYYGTQVWTHTSWMGVPCLKSVSDMWNYQEILFDRKPSLIVEFGSRYGGSAMYFATIMRQIGQPFRILSVDVDAETIRDQARLDPDIDFMQSSSVAAEVATRIAQLKAQYPGSIFAILDSLHTKDHVLAEMNLLRPLLTPGDYMIVEDSDLNGHPIVPGWGPGPYEAIEAYERDYPNDYRHDLDRESKFGWTAAPNGFLIRR